MKHALTALLCLAALGCSHETHGSEHGDASAAPSVAQQAVQNGPVSGEHHVSCGCRLDGIGTCGNYVQVDGHWVEIGGELGLGVMEFCGKGELTAEVEGEMKDGTLVASRLEVVAN